MQLERGLSSKTLNDVQNEVWRRVLADIPELHKAEVRVCKFDKEWWLLYYLWGDEEFRNKAIAVWFQMAELVWKSMYYENDPSFLEHEALGDELEWKHKSKLMDK